MFKETFLRLKGATILDAVRVLDSAAVGIALVVDDNDVLQGTITDGDVRRGLLRGETLASSIENILVRECFIVSPDVSRAQALDIMKARLFRQVPICDKSGKVVGLHLLNQLISNERRPNVAVVMAGGKGERLGDLTKYTPKPMLKVAGRPILERIILHLMGHGIDSVYISVNYHKEVIKEYFGDGAKFGCDIRYLEESVPLGSGGSISLLPPQNRSVVVMNGDLVTDVNISRLLDYHESHGFYATMGYTVYQHTIPFGCLEISDGRVIELQEKPTVVRKANAGIYVLSPEAVSAIPLGQYYMITNVFSEALAANLPCGACPVDGSWIDVGIPKDLRAARGV